jgi:hypothetical protein
MKNQQKGQLLLNFQFRVFYVISSRETWQLFHFAYSSENGFNGVKWKFNKVVFTGNYYFLLTKKILALKISACLDFPGHGGVKFEEENKKKRLKFAYRISGLAIIRDSPKRA